MTKSPTPLTPILEGYEPLTGEPVPLSAEALAEIKPMLSAYCNWQLVPRLLATIAARDETIAANCEVINEQITTIVGLEAQVKTFTHNWAKELAKDLTAAGEAEYGPLRANVGEPDTKPMPSVSPSPAIEAAREWIAAIINDHVVTAIAPMIIPPCAKEVWDDFSTTLAARILSPPATETAVAEIDPRKCPMGWCRLNNECFESGNKTSGCPLRAVEPSPLKTSRESTFTQTEKFILNRCQRGKGDPPMDCSYPDCEDYCFTKDQPSPTDAQLTAAICCGDSECPLKEWAAANKRTLDCETDQFDCRVKAVRALLLSRDAAMAKVERQRCAALAYDMALYTGVDVGMAIEALEPKP